MVGLNRDRIGQPIDPVTWLYRGHFAIDPVTWLCTGQLCHRSSYQRAHWVSLPQIQSLDCTYTGQNDSTEGNFAMDCSFLYCPPRTLSSPLALQCRMWKLNVDTDWIKKIVMWWRWGCWLAIIRGSEGGARANQGSREFWRNPIFCQCEHNRWPATYDQTTSDHRWSSTDHFLPVDTSFLDDFDQITFDQAMIIFGSSKPNFGGFAIFLIFSVCISLNASFYASQHSRVLIFCPTSSQSELLGRPYIGHGISPLNLAHCWETSRLPPSIGTYMHFEIWKN